MEGNNQSHKNLIERLALRYGVLMALALAGFFLLMKAFGLEHNLELRALNILILSSFVWMAMTKYKNIHHKELVYLKGFGLGILTSAVGVLSFALMVLFYITIISPEFMDVIRQREPYGDFLNPPLIAFAISIEGMGSGFITTFALLQFYRPNHIVAPMDEVV